LFFESTVRQNCTEKLVVLVAFEKMENGDDVGSKFFTACCTAPLHVVLRRVGKVEYHVFDVVDFNKPFHERKATEGFAKVVAFSHKINWVPTSQIICAGHADIAYADFVAAGYEGMMYRLGDCPYTVPKQEREGANYSLPGFTSRTRFLSDKDNRCWHLLKRKDWQDHEYTCTEVVEGEGKLQGTLGALVCRIPGQSQPNSSPSLTTFSVGSGLTDAQRNFYWNNPPIGKLIKVKYLCLSSDGIPLNPTVHPDHIIQ
jgi:hypothetical protein